MWAELTEVRALAGKAVQPYYRNSSDISRTKSQNLGVPRLVLRASPSNPLRAGCWVENDMAGAAPTGIAPAAFEWSAV